MRTVRRCAVVATCYLLSNFGIVYSLVLFALSGAHSLFSALIGIFILIAWAAHITMSFNWVINRRVQKYIPILGTGAGSISLILWPLASPQTTKGYETGWPILAAIGMGIAFTLPCLLLAIYLVRFHLKPSSGDAAVNS